jgi:acetylornithine/N-succinyldiaminopimelate aminotransferase
MKLTRASYDKVMIPCYVPMDMLVQKAHGCYMWDTDGRRYLDLTSGIAVNCLGHTPKSVVKIIRKQCRELMHVSNIFANVRTVQLAQKLVSLTDFDRVFFVNSGTEANEAALKMARRAALENFDESKDEIIAFSHSFHGRTFFSVCVAGQDKYSDGFGPKPGAITHLPFNDIEAFRKQISDKTCAVILEPVQGEGGIIPVDRAFLKEVRELCDKHHAYLIFDEVQTGIGRTGSLFCYQHLGVVPDILTTAKGLASGLPIGAVLAKEEVALHFGPGTHGSTFGGNALACTVGCHVLDVVSKPAFLEKVKAKGHDFSEALLELGKKHGVFTEVRGEGLLIGCVLADKYMGKSGMLQKLCFKRKLLVLVAGPDVLRIAPPLNIKRSHLKEGLALLDKALSDFVKENA